MALLIAWFNCVYGNAYEGLGGSVSIETKVNVLALVVRGWVEEGEEGRGGWMPNSTRVGSWLPYMLEWLARSTSTQARHSWRFGLEVLGFEPLVPVGD